MSTYRLRIRVPRRLRFSNREHSREDFFSWIWQRFGSSGLVGIHEGTLLSEEADAAIALDSAQAPPDRDWVGSRSSIEADLYFSSKIQAELAESALKPIVEVDGIHEQEEQDWDARWKESFPGVEVPPFWHILPPWVDAPAERGGVRVIRLNPGAGFGTGTHETTQLCLRALAERGSTRVRGRRVLDFGSGSGILSIGAALLGAQVDAVEIDPLALENSLENARLSHVENSIAFHEGLPDVPPGGYPVVLANILRPVLLEHCQELSQRLAKGGCLILSGLLESDVAQVSSKYGAALGTAPEILPLAEWRALVFEH